MRNGLGHARTGGAQRFKAVGFRREGVGVARLVGFEESGSFADPNPVTAVDAAAACLLRLGNPELSPK